MHLEDSQLPPSTGEVTAAGEDDIGKLNLKSIDTV